MAYTQISIVWATAVNTHVVISRRRRQSCRIVHDMYSVWALSQDASSVCIALSLAARPRLWDAVSKEGIPDLLAGVNPRVDEIRDRGLDTPSKKNNECGKYGVDIKDD